MRVINRSLSERGGNAASVHVVQVLVLLAVEDVVVDDLEASEARARRGPPMAYGVFSEFAERYRIAVTGTCIQLYFRGGCGGIC